jgi:hypothetical protein
MFPNAAEKIIRWCRKKVFDPEKQWLMAGLQKEYAQNTQNSGLDCSAWLCTQRRFIQGLEKIFKHYGMHHIDKRDGKREGSSLPDFLILLTDRAYYNMKVFPEVLRTFHRAMNATTTGSFDPSEPVAIAGCIRRYTIKEERIFTVPILGFGLILSRSVLENLSQPIRCNLPSGNSLFCNPSAESPIGESKVFRQGMTPADLMLAYANFDHFQNWTIGYCLEAE